MGSHLDLWIVGRRCSWQGWITKCGWKEKIFWDSLWDLQDISRLKNLRYVWLTAFFMKFQVLFSFLRPAADWDWGLARRFPIRTSAFLSLWSIPCSRTSRVESIDANHGFHETNVSTRNRYSLGKLLSQGLQRGRYFGGPLIFHVFISMCEVLERYAEKLARTFLKGFWLITAPGYPITFRLTPRPTKIIDSEVILNPFLLAIR